MSNLSDLIKQIAINALETEIFAGKITQTKPIELVDVDDETFSLSADELIIPEHLTDYNTIIEIDGNIKEVKIKNSLKKGDIVYVMSLKQSDFYIILGRKG